ncbi:hypothetical protein GRI97_08080 [Altererythrobacter xixiisoli]|uniref:Bacteriophage tail tape measure N-terminal domain-containing protein n=1 Tax=Croceibacterium xixiisoli TaxID=1476466 RepID=A0A6I4TST9_9SPHN|nr:hypothetical protein [Croceibacterium xixiisoli]MXO98944.1 hypothetical protein [Croceibacterium xixiisoli]
MTDTVFPAYLRLEHQDSVAGSAFLSEIDRALRPAESRLESFTREAQRQLNTAMTVPRTTAGSLNLDVGELQANARAQELRAKAAREVAEATARAAQAEGDYSHNARLARAATEALAREEEEAARASRSHADAIAQVQAQLNSQRSTVSVLSGEYLQLAQAETAAANGAQMLSAINASTGLDRAAKSARDSADAFRDLIEATAAQDERAAQGFLDNAFGLDRQTKSARESAQAFQEMFAEQERTAQTNAALAASAVELRTQLDPMYAAQRRFDDEMERADRLYDAGISGVREYAAAQQLARNNLRESAQAVMQNSTAVERAGQANSAVARSNQAAFVMLGQQMQDVLVQAQMGTSGITIFTQQVPQAAYALSGLADSSDETLSKVGEMASFMSGPWGAAFFAATAILGPFIYDLIFAGEAASEAEQKAYDFSNGMDVLRLSTGEASHAVAQLAEEMRAAIAVQGDFLDMQKNIATLGREQIEGRLATYQAELSRRRQQANSWTSLIPFNQPNYIQMGWYEQQIEEAEKQLGGSQGARQAELDAKIAVAQREVLERRDPLAAARGQYERAVGELKHRFDQSDADPVGAADRGIFISEEGYKAEFDRLTGIKEAAEAAARSARRTPRKERDTSAAELRAAQRLAEFAEDAERKIAAVRDRFSDIPPEVARVNSSTRELNDLISDLTTKKPENFAEMVRQAVELRDALPGLAFAQAMGDLNRASEEQIMLQTATNRGRREDVALVQEVLSLQRQFGPLNREQLETVRDIVSARESELEMLERAQDMQLNYLDTTRSVRSELEAIFAGRGSLANFGEIFRDLKARVTVENIFGDVLREMDEMVQGGGKLEDSVDYIVEQNERAAEAAATLAASLATTAQQISDPQTLSGLTFDEAFAHLRDPAGDAANDNEGHGNEIVVTGTRRTLSNMTPEAYFEAMSKKLVGPLTSELDSIFGTSFFSQMQGVLSGALYGYATGGDVGGILGAAQGAMKTFGNDIFGEKLGGAISGALGDALKGAQTGSMVAGLGNMLGLNMSGTGSQIGGMIGSALPIPGGDIIGAIAGGILGNMFTSTPDGNLGITGIGGRTQSRSSRDEIGSNLGSMAGQLDSRLKQIAEQLNAEIGAFSVSIGQREDYFRVGGDANFDAGAKHPKGALYNGKDAQAALEVAILNALNDGAMMGISRLSQNLLKNAKNLEEALADALDIEDVFNRLAQHRDPIGFEMDALDKEFSRLKDTFTSAGATAQEMADLEELYWIERNQLIKDATARELSTLRGFLDELTVGNSAISLRERQSMALSEYNPLAERVAAGDATAYDDYVEAARQLLDIQRQISGSQSGYFDLLAEITALTQGAFDDVTGGLSGIEDRESPFGTTAPADNAGVIDAVNNLRADIASGLANKLDAVNDNLGTLIAQNSSSQRMPVWQGSGGSW